MNTLYTFCILIASIGLLVYGHEYFIHICFERVPKSYLIEYIKFDRCQFHTESSLALRIPGSGLYQGETRRLVKGPSKAATAW